jgi:hypothetical protein
MSRLRPTDERGSVVVMVALWLPVLVLIMIFVIDVGNWWTHKRHLHLQADAAAWAGGDLFGSCFADAATADSLMQAEADKYVGVPAVGSLYNPQLGGANQGTLARLYNSKVYAAGSAPPDDTIEESSCTSSMFDVKVSEANLPLFFSGFIPGLSVVPAIGAHARVSLLTAGIGRHNFPLAVPDWNPSNVFVTAWDMTTGADLGTFALTGPTATGGPNYLNMWSGTISPSLPAAADRTIGLRVGLGRQPGSCFNVASGPGFMCFDGDPTVPLAIIHSYLGTGVPLYNNPLLDSLTETTCSGSPFFSDLNTTPCSATLTATVRWGDCPFGYTCDFTLTATDPNGSQNKVAIGSLTGQQYTFNLGPYDGGDGQEPVTLSWSSSVHGPGCGGGPPPPIPPQCSSGRNFLPLLPTWGNGGGKPVHQEAYSANSDLDTTGPVKIFSLSTPNSFQAGTTPSITVTVGLEGNLGSLPVPPDCSGSGCPLILMRVSSKAGGRSTVVDCSGIVGGGGNGGVRDAIINGCPQEYGINPTGICPDSATAPPDCVPLALGNYGVTVSNALNTRLAGCPAIQFPPPDPTTDKRVAQTVLTDPGSLFLGSGAGLVPVNQFGGFYITGWSNSACSNNDPPPAGFSPKPGKSGVAIWGHFFAYVNPDDSGGTPPNPCVISDPTINPCVPVLTR